MHVNSNSFFVTTSKALVTTSVALVTNSFLFLIASLLLLVRHLLLLAWHLFLLASWYMVDCLKMSRGFQCLVMTRASWCKLDKHVAGIAIFCTTILILGPLLLQSRNLAHCCKPEFPTSWPLLCNLLFGRLSNHQQLSRLSQTFETFPHTSFTRLLQCY